MRRRVASRGRLEDAGRGGGQIGGVDTCVKDRCHTEQSRKWDSSQKRDDGGPETPKSFSLEMCVCVDSGLAS